MPLSEYPIVCIDTETFGLRRNTQPIWEVAAVWPDGGQNLWQLDWSHRGEEPELLQDILADAHPFALEMNGYLGRFGVDPKLDDVSYRVCTPFEFIIQFSMQLKVVESDFGAKAHLAGAVVSFDEERIRELYDVHTNTPEGEDINYPWHYHLIDVESMLLDRYATLEGKVPSIPYKAIQLAEAFDIEPTPDEERHTALGDARWVKRVLETLLP
jgi:hypothetical protein